MNYLGQVGIIRAAADHSSYLAQRTFGALDGLRCLCIVAVVWHHSGPIESSSIAGRGFLGVDLFFVISGYLIVTLLLREKDRTGSISLKNFYMRRTLRIFPLYYAMVFALAAYYGFLNTQSELGDQYLRDLFVYLTYTGNFVVVGWGVVWSLAAEEQFYLIWPQVERHLSKYLVPILVMGLIFNQMLNFPTTRNVIGDWLGTDLNALPIVHATFTPILLGVCLAHALHNPNIFARLTILYGRYASLMWAGVLLGILLLPNDNIAGWHRLAVHVAMVGLVGSCVVREDHPLMLFLRIPLVARIGVVSYGIYLLHIHSIVVAEKILAKLDFHHDLAPFVLGLSISLLAAEISYRFFERRFLAIKQQFTR